MPNNYVLLETIALTQSAASVTFDNLPTSGYTDLKIVYSARTNAGGTSDHILMQFNNSTTSLSGIRLVGNGAATASYAVTTGPAGQSNGSGSTANTFGSGEIYIPNYRSSTNKSWSADGVSENNATGVGSAAAEINAGLWSNTAAITSIKLIQEIGTAFLAGSTFSLYGVAAFGTTPILAPKATGGNIVANDGTYWYHAFLSSGNFISQTNLTCDVLQVAGGGGGATNWGAGGGAGGLLAFTSQALATNTLFPVLVGAGGGAGTNGSNSQFASLTASVGGGRGGTENFPAPNPLTNGGTGGSGGGGGRGSTPGTGGAASPSGQGNAGGNGGTNSGGGGGGATGVGANASGSVGGTGGTASSAYSSWLSVTSMGVSGAIAGGGGGMSSQGAPVGAAGGGGGAGAGADNGVNSGAAGGSAVANTGSGGGGGAGASGLGGNGASGFVIIRYPIAS